jgi:prepilin-type N-terminal cleavage/methylation domain-containing protein
MNQRGMTLVENLVSMMLLTIVLTTGMSFFFGANKMTTLVVHKKMATELVNTKMEDLRRVAYSSVITAAAENVSVGALTGQRTVVVTDVDDPVGAGTDYKEVRVGVSWVEAENNTTRATEAVTYIAP